MNSRLSLAALALLLAAAGWWIVSTPPEAKSEGTNSPAADALPVAELSSEVLHQGAPVRTSVAPQIEVEPAAEGAAAPEDPNACILVTRLLDRDGNPLPGSQWIAQILLDTLGGQAVSGAAVTADDEGWIHVIAKNALAPNGRTRILAVWTHIREEGIYRARAVPVPDTLHPGKTRLRDVRFDGPPLLSGRIVDPAGEPVQDATVFLRDYSNGLLLGIMETPASGRFEYDVPFPESVLLNLEVYPPIEFKPVRREVAAGAQDLEVRLVAETALRGRILLPDGFPRTDVSVDADFPDKEQVHYGYIQENGDFRIAGLPPGQLLHVTVTAWRSGEILFAAEYQLGEGEQLAPDELNPIDLRDLHWHRLRVVDSSGASRMDWRYSLPGVHGDAPTAGLHALSQSPSWQVLISAPGFRTDLVNLRGQTTHELEPAPVVPIEYSGPPLPAGYKLHLNFALWFERDDGERVFNYIRTNLHSGTTRSSVQLFGDGFYTVNASLTMPDSNRATKFPLPAEYAEFRARGTTPYHLTLPAGAFTKALGEGDD